MRKTHITSLAALLLVFSAATERAGAQPRSCNWRLRGNAPPGLGPRYLHAMAFHDDSDPIHRGTLLFGGRTGPSRLHGDTWLWDGAEWVLRSLTGPSARDGHAMAYDRACGVTVLFGGSHIGGGWNGETWVWDGRAWTQPNVTGPTGRAYHAMAYHDDSNPQERRTLLFGGWTGSAYSDETWLWSCGAWTRVDVPGPSARARHAMAYDSARGVTVLFGGEGPNQRLLEDTWEWDGSTWMARPERGPSARWGHAMAYDSVRRVTVLFGGVTTGGYDGETWEWDGSAWRLGSQVGPSPRVWHAMAFHDDSDPNERQTVLFGGSAVAGDNAETWGLKWCGHCPGDVNGDARVNQTDLGILLSAWGCVGEGCPGDLNGDGRVDQRDLGILLANWGRECP